MLDQACSFRDVLCSDVVGGALLIVTPPTSPVVGFARTVRSMCQCGAEQHADNNESGFHGCILLQDVTLLPRKLARSSFRDRFDAFLVIGRLLQP